MRISANRRAALALLVSLLTCGASELAAPAPLLQSGQPVDWWFVFKFNDGSFPGCANAAPQACLFGGKVKPYKFSQQYISASSADQTLKQGGGCLGDTTGDPVGATFDQVYNGNFFYVLWNDQFKGDPMASKDAPAGHSKGMLAWNADGEGLVMQVSTPSWPGAGNAANPRKNDGNTLGCVTDDDVLVSQHFFALKLTRDDVVTVLKALVNASVVTDPKKPQLVNNGGPADIQALVKTLGKTSKSKAVSMTTLSTGVVLISKPSNLLTPPWQLVSAMLDGEPLRAATWWADPKIPSSDASTPIGCWDSSLHAPGAVEIATSGAWDGKSMGMGGGDIPEGNHAKIGISTGTHTYSIFGDMNQQGSLTGDCKSSQNHRGGMFFVIDNAPLFNGMKALLQGSSAPK